MSWLSLLLAKSASGMLMYFVLQPGQYFVNSVLMADCIPGEGMTPPTIGMSASILVPLASLMTQSASSAAALLKGAVSRAVTPAEQPSQAGGGVVESS